MRVATIATPCLFSLGVFLGLGAEAFASSPAQVDEAAAIPLFNGQNLDGWYVCINYPDGSDQSVDTKGIFTVKDGAIRASGEVFGCLTTKKEYENYRLSFEFKWGEKKWPPRENAIRDAGVLVHVVGPDKVWPQSIECQIQEGDCGDFYILDGVSIDIDGKTVKGFARHVKSADHEKPHGEWNTVEVVCDGGDVTNIINGHVVNHGTNATIRKGKIVLQSEGAEIFYRNVTLTPIEKK